MELSLESLYKNLPASNVPGQVRCAIKGWAVPILWCTWYKPLMLSDLDADWSRNAAQLALTQCDQYGWVFPIQDLQLGCSFNTFRKACGHDFKNKWMCVGNFLFYAFHTYMHTYKKESLIYRMHPIIWNWYFFTRKLHWRQWYTCSKSWSKERTKTSFSPFIMYDFTSTGISHSLSKFGPWLSARTFKALVDITIFAWCCCAKYSALRSALTVK